MKSDDKTYFHADAAIPFLVTRVISLAVSVGLYWCLISVYQAIAGSPTPQLLRIASPFAIVGALEYCLTLGNSGKPSLDARLYWRLAWLIQLPRYWIARFARKLTQAAFFAISIAMVIEIVKRVSSGWSGAPTATPQGHDLAMAGLSLALGILAIFSTVIGLVLQSTMQDYSPSFIWVITRNKVYLTFAALSLSISVLNLTLLDRSMTPDLAWASLTGSIYCITSLPFLIYETFYFLDVSHVTTELANAAVRFVRETVRQQAPIMSADPRHDPSPAIPVTTLWRMFIEKWVLGSMRVDTVLPKFEVPDEVITVLEEKVRPITSTCLKAIASDRREVVLACLRNLSYVTDGYIRARRSYEGRTDSFLLFIAGQSEIVFNAALASANQQYTSDVTDAVGYFARSSLALTRALGGGYPENSDVAVFSGLLEKIAIRSFHLAHTDAPMKACRWVGQIGNRLLTLDAYVPVLFTISGNLTTIGHFCAMQKGAWPAVLTQTTVSGFVSMLQTSLRQALKTGYRYDAASDILLENLGTILSAWYENDHGHMDNQTVIAPLVGGLFQGPKVSGIFADVLRSTIPNTAILGVLEDLEKIARQLGILAQRAIAQNRTPQYEYFGAFAEMVYEAVRFAAGNSEPEISREVDAFLKRTVSPALWPIAEAYRNPSYHALNDLFDLSPSWAFLMHYYRESKRPAILNVYVTTLRDLIRIDGKVADSVRGDHHKLAELYKYIKLFGAWLNRFTPNHPCNKEVLLFLAKNHDLERRREDRSFRSEMDYYGYPGDNIHSAWYIHPSPHWTGQQWPVTQELNDLTSYKAYDRLVRHIANRLRA